MINLYVPEGHLKMRGRGLSQRDSNLLIRKRLVLESDTPEFKPGLNEPSLGGYSPSFYLHFLVRTKWGSCSAYNVVCFEH